uniref:P-type domain-containing protein n=1 Tax=Plectus sambesii TaxID=2011161 RepID=A0A914XFT1_9BILA
MLLLTCLVAVLLTGESRGQAVDKTLRIDCFPEPGSSQQGCISRGCIYDTNFDQSHPTVPLCYYPSGTGYSLSSSGLANPYILNKKSDSVKNPYGADISPISVYHSNIGATLNVKIGVQGRYEPPVQFPRNPSTSSDSLRFSVSDDGNLFSFQVKRASTGTNLWDTSIGGLLFADKYIQIATHLPTDAVYGFGEAIHQSIKHDFTQYTTWAMFARDEPPDSAGQDTKNLYGVHPFYVCLEQDGNAHGVLILNSNAQEITTGMGPHLIYRTIGGNVDLYFFPGPKPEDVINQYLALIGTPALPAYWALGFQLCRYGYHNLGEMQAAVTRTQQAGIPLDVAYADIDYMDRYKDFTTGSAWSGFPQYADQLHQAGMRIILIFDPAIQADYDSFQRGISSGARFIEWARQDQVPSAINGQYPYVQGTKIMLGVVWPDKHVGFPDFLETSGNTNKWWADEFTRYHSQMGFDGIWIDMNEPSNFGTNQNHPWYYDDDDHPNIPPLFCPLTGPDSVLEVPPYQTQAVYHYGNSQLSSNTLCMSAKMGGGSYNFYDAKCLYGWSEARATRQALSQATGKRGAIIS